MEEKIKLNSSVLCLDGGDNKFGDRKVFISILTYDVSKLLSNFTFVPCLRYFDPCLPRLSLQCRKWFEGILIFLLGMRPWQIIIDVLACCFWGECQQIIRFNGLSLGDVKDWCDFEWCVVFISSLMWKLQVLPNWDLMGWERKRLLKKYAQKVELTHFPCLLHKFPAIYLTDSNKRVASNERKIVFV